MIKELALKFGLPCTPSTYLHKKEYDVMKIIISYGGGMGGVNQTYYVVESNKLFGKAKLLSLTLLDGTRIEINSRYIVSIEDCTVLEIVVDTTGHKYFGQAPKGKNVISHNFFEVKQNETYEIDTENYMGSSSKESNRKIMTWTDIS